MIAVTMTLETPARTMASEVSVRVTAGPRRDGEAGRRGEDHDSLCRHVLQVAQSQARRQGLRGEAAEDCALEFVERILLRGDWSALRLPQTLNGGLRTDSSEAWLRRCADNFARNVQRGRRRAARHETPWPEWEDAEGGAFGWEGPADRETPEALLLRRDLDLRIQAAVGRLTPSQRDLFARHYLAGETVTEMGNALGRSPHAVSQALVTLRRRLRGLLERQGLDEEVARQYLEDAGSAREYQPFPHKR